MVLPATNEVHNLYSIVVMKYSALPLTPSHDLTIKLNGDSGSRQIELIY